MAAASPDIRFATTDDGVSIAFWELGTGKPVIITHQWSLSHAELEWRVPSMKSFYLAMARRYRLIRYDPRGIGLSSDPPGGWGTPSQSGAQVGMSSYDMGLDLAAVASACRVDGFALMAVSALGPVAIQFAATHRGMVSELILYDSMADVASSHLVPLLKTYKAVTEIQEDVGTTVPINPWERYVKYDEVDQLSALVNAANRRVVWTPKQVQLEWNATGVLDEIRIPTLVLCSRNSPIKALLADGRQLASRMPNAQLRVVDGSSTPYFADQTAVLAAIDEFLRTEVPIDAGFRTVVFTDVVDSTKFTAVVGDQAGRTAMRAVEERVASMAQQHGGTVVKNLGDGSLVSFGSNTAALRFAVDVQEKTEPGSLQLRIGMAAGEPIQESGDIHGAVVAYASRVADLGGAGDIIVSDTVRQLAMGKGFEFASMGQHELKGFDEPATVWKVSRSA